MKCRAPKSHTCFNTPHVAVMLAKLIVLCCACAAAVAAPGIYDVVPAYGHAIAPAYASHAIAPAYASHAIAPAYAAPLVRAEPIDPNPSYSFAYGVADPTTGDQKDASETLQNGVVQGSYSLVEPDGHVRRVTYTADKINGFNAVVERTGGAHAVAPAHVAVAAPVAKLTLPALAHPWG